MIARLVCRTPGYDLGELGSENGILPVQPGCESVMIFQHVDLNNQRLIEGTRYDCESIKVYCGYLLAELTKFFALNHAQANFGVSFTATDDLVSAVSTPYGEARGRLTIQLVEGVVEGRYVFEKSVVSDEGQDIWRPIWAIRIGRYGNVLLGDEGVIEIDVTNVGPHSNAISAPAKSLLYSIANTPIFKR